jgi:hypothetical protein
MSEKKENRNTKSNQLAQASPVNYKLQELAADNNQAIMLLLKHALLVIRKIYTTLIEIFSL